MHRSRKSISNKPPKIFINLIFGEIPSVNGSPNTASFRWTGIGGWDGVGGGELDLRVEYISAPPVITPAVNNAANSTMRDIWRGIAGDDGESRENF
jgi:hypothetical protein